MNYKYTIADGVRMVGHLLEHHPTTGVLAKHKNGRTIGIMEKNASFWCLFGAVHVVSWKLHLNSLKLANEVVDVTGVKTGPQWDHHNDKATVCKKLQEYKG